MKIPSLLSAPPDSNKIAVVLGGFFLILFGLFGATAFSQSPESSPAGLEVTPAINVINLEPGMRNVLTLRLYNPISQAVTLYPQAFDLRSGDKRGSPAFFIDSNQNSPYSVSRYLKFHQEQLNLAPRQSVKFDFIIEVPQDIEPGGHYGAVVFSTEKPSLENQSEGAHVSFIGSISSLILATVPGDLNELLVIENFISPKLLWRPPANFQLTISNNGNIHQVPEGMISFRNWFGNPVGSVKVNEEKGFILPDSSRQFDASWQFNWKTIGKVTAIANLEYGSRQLSVSEIRSFYVIPVWLVSILVLGLFILLLWIMTMLLKRRFKQSINNQLIKPRRRIIQ